MYIESPDARRFAGMLSLIFSFIMAYPYFKGPWRLSAGNVSPILWGVGICLCAVIFIFGMTFLTPTNSPTIRGGESE